jgi:hypothetical protein
VVVEVDVVVLVEVEVDVVVGGGGGAVVVVEVEVAVGGPATGGGGVKDHMAAAQSCGWAATTTSTPGSVENDQTASGRPVWRQARAGSVVESEVRMPTYWAVPPAGGGLIGFKGTLTPFQVPVVTNPVPGGAVVAVVDVGPVE